LRWILLLEEYGVTFEYIPVKKNVPASTDTLSRLDINSLKIQEEEEEVLPLLSGSENNSTSNIKLMIPMHTALICKEQTNRNSQKIKRKGLSPATFLNH
jgi:hypothetical protein